MEKAIACGLFEKCYTFRENDKEGIQSCKYECHKNTLTYCSFYDLPTFCEKVSCPPLPSLEEMWHIERMIRDIEQKRNITPKPVRFIHSRWRTHRLTLRKRFFVKGVKYLWLFDDYGAKELLVSPEKCVFGRNEVSMDNVLVRNPEYYGTDTKVFIELREDITPEPNI